MTCKCQHCGKHISYRWWNSKIRLKCKYCNRNVFTGVKFKLQVLNFTAALMGVLQSSFILHSSYRIIIRIILFVLTSIILYPIFNIVEKKICKSAVGDI